MTDKLSRPLALLRLLDAVSYWNKLEEEEGLPKIPEPSGTSEIVADARVAAHVGRTLDVPAWFAFECVVGEPVKGVRAIRDWILSKQTEDDYDPAQMLYRYARKHGHEVGSDSLEAAREEMAS